MKDKINSLNRSDVSSFELKMKKANEVVLMNKFVILGSQFLSSVLC